MCMQDNCAYSGWGWIQGREARAQLEPTKVKLNTVSLSMCLEKDYAFKFVYQRGFLRLLDTLYRNPM